jgi:soluble lytic murein transglycosylase-like protein
MAKVLFEGSDRRRVDRRRGGDRQLRWRGVERRRGDRRIATATAAAGVMVAGLLAAPRAEAQIYTWHDAKGRLVLSNSQSGPNAKLYATLKGPDTAPKDGPPKPRRGSEYDDLIDEHATAHGVRPELVRAVIQQESNFNPRARSSKGAMGLMQLMPGTAADLGVINPFNALENIRGGIKYLRRLLNRYDNNEVLALAAYNAGPGAVDRYGSQVPPYRETQEYVKRILGSMQSAVAATAKASVTVIYKTTQVIDGHAVPQYSTSKPASGPYQVLKLG